MSQARAFDYLVVGAGSAGCVLASRLSADPAVSVCLIEAGPEDRSPLIHMPFGVIALMRSKLLNWAFWTEPQPALGGRRLFWPRGRMLGGSSSMNAMVYMRGHHRDYDEWERLGNRGWGWKDVLPAFKKAENNERGASELHGVGGPLNVAEQRARNRLSSVFIQAAQEAGYPLNDDFNGPDQEGFGFYQVTQKDGRRCSAARAYLGPVRARPNLTVLTDARAMRVLFAGRRASGIELHRNGRVEELQAAREVILCGGALNSPQLLLLSGIGPAIELRRHGIPQVQELPGVGQNLQDHLDITLVYRARRLSSYAFSLLALPAMLKGLFDYLFRGRGLFSSNLAEAGGFLRTRPELERPDVQFHFIPAPLRDHGLKLIFGYGYSCHVCDLRPRSRGHVALKSANPLDDPLIQPNYLREPEDLDTLMRGYRALQRIFAARAFDRFRGQPLLPEREMRSEEEVREDIRQRAETVYHPVGSCRMGSDPMAVVDAQLRVHGVEGLRVADASVMPTLIGGNTNAPCIMIGERAAEMILAERAAEQQARSQELRAAV